MKEDDENIGQIFCYVIMVALPITVILVWIYLNKTARLYQNEMLARKLRFKICLFYYTNPYKRKGDISVSPVQQKKICRPSSFPGIHQCFSLKNTKKLVARVYDFIFSANERHRLTVGPTDSRIDATVTHSCNNWEYQQNVYVNQTQKLKRNSLPY